MTTEIVRYADSVTGADVELSIDKIRQGLCPLATEQEAVMFLELCRHMGLNPWVKDAYLIKYDDKRPATMVVGKDAFTKRADSNPHFAGIESGVIVPMGDKLEYRKGTLVLKGEVIVGGWAKVARTDRKIDIDTTVTFDEYNTKRGVWNNMPAVMIEKCAIVKALRSAFPATFSGMYDSSEMREIRMDEQGEIVLDAEGPVVVKDTPRPAPQVKNIDPHTAQEVVRDSSGDVHRTSHAENPDPECLDCQADSVALFISPPPEDADDPAEEEPDEGGPTCQGSVLEYEMPPPCDKPGHEEVGNWEITMNDVTEERRFTHMYPYQLNGKRVQGWCVYTGGIPVPPTA